MKPYRWLVALLVAAVLGVLAAQWMAQQDPAQMGRVIVRTGGYDYSASLPVAIALLLAAMVLLAILWHLLRLPFRAWGRYRKRQGRGRLIEGMRAVYGGRWSQGERLLGTAADDAEAGTLALAGAVRAADARGDEAAAEQWLAQLGTRDPVLHAVLKAERLLAHGRPVDAINALDVAEAQPLPPRGLLLRARALAAVHRAGEAYGLLGALRQQGALPPDGLAALEIELAAASLEETDDANLLAERWEAMPKPLRTEPAVIGAYARRASALGWHDAAMRHLEQALDVHWDEELVDLYARLPVGHVDSRRASAQRWLQQHPHSPALLVALARLARGQEQWPQARDFLRRALEEGAGADAWELLGDGLAESGDHALAAQAYANALLAARGEPVQPLPERMLEPTPGFTPEERDANGLPRLVE